MKAQLRVVPANQAARREHGKRLGRLIIDALAKHWIMPTIIISAMSCLYGFALILEHLASGNIANHSLLNFTPQLSIGLTLFTGGLIGAGTAIRSLIYRHE